jgi:hypothetical protein
MGFVFHQRLDGHLYTRFRWREAADLEKIAAMLENKFKVVRRDMPTSEHDIISI